MASADVLVAQITDAKKRWEAARTAGDQAAMDKAHADAEAARAQVGFSGGADGSKNIALPIVSPYAQVMPQTAAPKAPTIAVPTVRAAPAALTSGQLGSVAAGAQTAASSSIGSSLSAIRDSYAGKTAMPTPAALPTVSDNTADIEALYAAQQAARLSALEKARDASMSALQGEQAAIAPKYQDGRNAAGSQSEMNRLNMAEYMANRGMTNSGASSQMEISRMGALQGQVGSLNQQEIANNADIERRRSSTTAGYESDAATAQAEIRAQQVAATIAERNRVYESNYRRAVDMYGMESQQAQMAYQQMRDAMGDAINVDQIGYSRGRDAVSDARAANQDEYGRWMDGTQLEQQAYENAYRQSRDGVGDAQWSSQFDRGVLESDRNYDRGVLEGDRNYDLQVTAQTATLAAQSLDNEIKQMQLDMQRDPNSVENQTMAIQLENAKFSLEQAKALAQYAPEQAQLQLDQIRASIRATNASAAASAASIRNTTADNTRQDDNTAYDRFITNWQALGYAPANSFGIQQGTVYAPGVKQTSTQPAAPADLLSIREDLNKALMGTEQPVYNSDGKKVGVSQVQKMTAEAALQQIKLMEALGQITEPEADQLAMSIPAVNAYMQSIANRTNSQTRY